MPDLPALLPVQVDGGQSVLDAVGRESQVGGHHDEVLPAGQGRVVGGALDEGSDRSRGQRPAGADRTSQDTYVSRRRAGQSQQELHGGGLAGSVGSQEPVDTAGGYSQVHPVDDVDAVVGAGQAVGGHRELSDRGRLGGEEGAGSETGLATGRPVVMS